LVMVPNPAHNPAGDFSLQGALVREGGTEKLTYSGVAVYHPRLFEGCSAGKFSIVPLLLRAMREQIVTGERYDGPWNDIGTLERLDEARTLAGRPGLEKRGQAG
ncbi:MAG: mannose-1-phosphate guanylyltransferase, partial [Gammaproteobacteria bacterium]|nr:mannose-1-phosphate guanylyltransferase [Gammaproteobacteria bacterium]